MQIRQIMLISKMKMLIFANRLQGIQNIFLQNLSWREISTQTTKSTFEVKYLINYIFLAVS